MISKERKAELRTKAAELSQRNPALDTENVMLILFRQLNPEERDFVAIMLAGLDDPDDTTNEAIANLPE